MAHNMSTIWGQRIRLIRNHRNLSQQQLGEKVGLKKLSILHIEDGTRQLHVGELLSIAAALEVTPETLYRNEPLKITIGLGEDNQFDI